MKTLNPVLALVGAASKAGNTYLARELMELSRGHRDALAIKKSSKRFSGFHLITIAKVIDDKIQAKV